MILVDEETGKRYKMEELGTSRYKATLRRTSDNGTQTTGELKVYEDDKLVFTCMTLEMPWKDNNTNVSCIPKGSYDVKPYSSAKYPDTYEVLSVPNRSYILIHWGNYYTNTEGCILVGEYFVDINSDGQIDITNSRDTVKELKKATNYNDFRLTII